MADSQRKTDNLFNTTIERGSFNPSGEVIPATTRLATGFTGEMLSPNVYYTINAVGVDDVILEVYDSDKTYLPSSSVASWQTLPYTFSRAQSVYVRFGFRKHDNSEITIDDISNIMFNTGSTALPFEPYWQHSLRKLTTATEAVENPLYSDGTAITAYTIKGNTEQNGTPTPSNPVDVVGVGTLDSGQYKIPISSGGVTTNIYLGSTQTVRAIKKLVLSGDENFDYYSVAQGSLFRLTLNNSPVKSQLSEMATCSHYEVVIATNRTNMTLSGILTVGSNVTTMDFINNDYNNATEFKAHLAAQYAAGTPVTVWYVLATPETAAVNEPLMKIGTYADTLSNAAQIPTTEGANSITVDTTVQPSEFTATWTGWHDSSVKEWDGSQWG